MNARELALVQGWSDTRATLAAWNRAPMAVLPGWLGLSAAIAGLLLVSVVVVAMVSAPDSTPLVIHGLHTDPSADQVLTIVLRNSLVLALHAMACVAGFIAKSSLPREAASYSGLWRRIHDHAGPAAITFVAGATIFSLATQSYALGARLSTLAEQFGTTPAALLLAMLPHALPELVAIFLPLAAWLIAARAEAWHQLLAATFSTTAIAAPVVVLAALVEVYLTPELLRALQFV